MRVASAQRSTKPVTIKPRCTLIQVLHHGPKGFVAAPKRGGWQYSRVFERYFHLERKRDRGGLWEYTLLVKK